MQRDVAKATIISQVACSDASHYQAAKKSRGNTPDDFRVDDMLHDRYRKEAEEQRKQKEELAAAK